MTIADNAFSVRSHVILKRIWCSIWYSIQHMPPASNTFCSIAFLIQNHMTFQRNRSSGEKIIGESVHDSIYSDFAMQHHTPCNDSLYSMACHPCMALAIQQHLSWDSQDYCLFSGIFSATTSYVQHMYLLWSLSHTTSFLNELSAQRAVSSIHLSD